MTCFSSRREVIRGLFVCREFEPLDAPPYPKESYPNFKILLTFHTGTRISYHHCPFCPVHDYHTNECLKRTCAVAEIEVNQTCMPFNLQVSTPQRVWCIFSDGQDRDKRREDRDRVANVRSGSGSPIRKKESVTIIAYTIQ